jgi:hypothetical protein
MGRKSLLTKVLAVTGTILLWLPILATLVIGVITSFQTKEFHFDYLIPAELFLVVIAGGLMLLWASLRERFHRRLLIGGVIGMFVIFLTMNLITIVSGLSSGATDPSGFIWGLVIMMLVLYYLAILLTGVLGILLVRDLFRQTG